MKPLSTLRFVVFAAAVTATTLHADTPTPPPPPETSSTATEAAESLSNRKLREVLERERAVLALQRQYPDDPDTAARVETGVRDLRTAYEAVLLANPRFAPGYAAYGLFLARTEDRERAIQYLARALKLDPALAPAQSQLGNLLFEDGRYQDALGCFLAAVDLQPGEPHYHYQLGSLLAEYRRFFVADGIFTRETLDAKIQETFRRALALAPDDWRYLYRHAESFYDLDRPDWPAALATWETLRKKAQPGLEAQTITLHIINVLLLLERRDEARAQLATIDDSSLQPAREKLAARLDAPPPAPPTSPEPAATSPAPAATTP